MRRRLLGSLDSPFIDIHDSLDAPFIDIPGSLDGEIGGITPTGPIALVQTGTLKALVQTGTLTALVQTGSA